MTAPSPITQPAKRKRSVLRALLRAAILLLFLAILGWWVLPLTVQLPDKLLQPQPVSTTFLAADGSKLRQLLTDDELRIASPAVYADLPQPLIHAVLSAEDKRFFSHGGVDLAAISRAAWQNLIQQRVTSGASTLTQQLIKISADKRQPRTLWTKITEALQARRLEMQWSKEDILTAYLNRVYFGCLLTGINSAVDGYLNKPLRDLTPAECAFLASLPQAPSRLNPYRNPQGIKKRQRLVLDNMRENGWLVGEAYDLACNETLKLHRYTGGFQAPHATELAKWQNTKSDVTTASVIQTTIQPKLQSRVESIILHRLNSLVNKNVNQAAAVVLENKTGKVLALAGSRDFFTSVGGQINGAWAPHSPGSALKPFTYLLALDRGYTAGSIIPDLPIEYATTTGLYRPENYDKQNHGPVTLRAALGSSLNIPAVRLLEKVGGASVLQKALQDLGLTTLTEKSEHYGLGLTIGNAPVRLIELANAYATLARLGEYKPWTLLKSNDEEKQTEGKRLLSANTCYVISDILTDNQARVMTFGPYSIIRMGFPCAVKTGTSTSYRDNWAMGYTPEYTVAVWVGNFDNTPMNQVSGVTGAGPIFHDIFQYLHDTAGTTWFTQPAELTRLTIDPRNGKRVASDSPSPRMTRQEVFQPKSIPTAATSNDYDEQGRAYLPLEYKTWHQSASSSLTELLTIRTNAEHTPLRIITPTNGSVFILDPDLPDQGSRLLLRANELPDIEWSSSTLEIITTNHQYYALLTPGRHIVELKQSGSDERVTASIEVRPPLQKKPVGHQLNARD